MEEVTSKEKRLVFLTLTMNKKNLEQIIREARVYGFKPVIRGFKDGSYIATAKYLSDIIEKTGYGVEVDPESFKEFDVKLVPTFVIAAPKCTEGNCKWDKFNKVTGNISFDHVLRLFAIRGDDLEGGRK
jgi:conjugal transfer pilus assembly protein TrbC